MTSIARSCGVCAAGREISNIPNLPCLSYKRPRKKQSVARDTVHV